jgi:hypothetical protein
MARCLVLSQVIGVRVSVPELSLRDVHWRATHALNVSHCWFDSNSRSIPEQPIPDTKPPMLLGDIRDLAFWNCALVVGTVDTTDLKSVALRSVRVRLSPRA